MFTVPRDKRASSLKFKIISLHDFITRIRVFYSTIKSKPDNRNVILRRNQLLRKTEQTQSTQDLVGERGHTRPSCINGSNICRFTVFPIVFSYAYCVHPSNLLTSYFRWKKHYCIVVVRVASLLLATDRQRDTSAHVRAAFMRGFDRIEKKLIILPA